MPVPSIIVALVLAALAPAEVRAADSPAWVCTTADCPWVEQPPPAVVTDLATVPDAVVHPSVCG